MMNGVEKMFSGQQMIIALLVTAILVVVQINLSKKKNALIGIVLPILTFNRSLGIYQTQIKQQADTNVTPEVSESVESGETCVIDYASLTELSTEEVLNNCLAELGIDTEVEIVETPDVEAMNAPLFLMVANIPTVILLSTHMMCRRLKQEDMIIETETNS